MRHFGFLAADQRRRLFLHAPEEFAADEDAAVVGTGLGATLYCPATRPALADDIRRRAATGTVSVVVCLEDAVADDDLVAAERNAVAQLRRLGETGGPMPLLFVRVRHEAQIGMVVRALGVHVDVLTGFVVPKFGEESAGVLEAVAAASAESGHRLLVMPVLETGDVAHLESRAGSLLGARRLVDKYPDLVPAVRVGATDLSGAWGLRRSREFTVWDVRVVADAIADIVNVFGRPGAGGHVVTGPVWEYFPAPERMFRTLLRESPFAEHAEGDLRADLLAADLDGLLREVALDQANGLTGKTVIHPTHVAAVHALSVVSHEEYDDAAAVVSTAARGGASASSYRNKMNESRPHTEWARRTLLRARIFGVAREQVSFVDLLGAGLRR